MQAANEFLLVLKSGLQVLQIYVLSLQVSIMIYYILSVYSVVECDQFMNRSQYSLDVRWTNFGQKMNITAKFETEGLLVMISKQAQKVGFYRCARIWLFGAGR